MAKQAEATLLLKIKEVGQGILDRFVITLGDITNIAKKVGSAIVGFGESAVSAFKAQESAVNSLNQSLVQQGIFTAELSKRYQDMATSLQKTTAVADEQIIASQALIQGYIGETQITKELMQATLDFAAAKKIDLATAADLVGKTIGSTTNALARYGVVIAEDATESERMAAVIGSLNGKFGGQAEAATRGLGIFQKLRIAYDEILEKIGAQLAPVLEFFANKLLHLATVAEGNSSVFKFLGDTFVFAAQSALVFKFVLDEMVNVFQFLSSGIEQVALLLQGKFSEAAAIGGQAVSDFAARTKADYEEMLNQINQLDEAHRTAQMEKQMVDEQNQVAAGQRKLQIERDQRVISAEEERIAYESGVTEKEARRMQREADTLSEIENRERLQYAADQRERLRAQGMANFHKMVNSTQVRDQQSVFSQIETLSNSHNKALAAIGKAAAIANIIINTSRGISLALATFPWPFANVIAGLVGAAGAAQIATVAGVKLADGGIVQATPGGVPAIIGEGGRDEAVVPLDDDGFPSIGNKINIVINGGFLGDPASARQLALAVDQELLKLRKNNESRSFDTGII